MRGPGNSGLAFAPTIYMTSLLTLRLLPDWCIAANGSLVPMHEIAAR
jgi:hypothetical protein